MGPEATLILERPRPTAATITFTALAFARPRWLEVRVADHTAAILVIGTEPTPATGWVPAGQGPARLTLRSLDGADSPLDLLGSPDDRRLSVLLTNVQLAAEP
jgi:hypothetical protein